MKTAPALWIYIAFDAGDRFYDSVPRQELVRAWIDSHMVAPLRSAGVRVQHAMLRFRNDLRKPGPVFNFMMAAAAIDGAHVASLKQRPPQRLNVCLR